MPRLRPEDDLAAEAEALLDRGQVTVDGEGRIRITAAGERARLAMKAHAPAIRARIHRGVEDADYVVAVKVLQQLIRDVTPPPPGGAADNGAPPRPVPHSPPG